MKRRLLAVVAAAALLFSAPAPASAAEPVTLESQAWWNDAGIVVPSAVGAHMHVRATVPDPKTTVSGKIDIPVTVTAHDQRGATSWFRIQDERGTVLFSRDLVLGPCHDCSVSFDAVVDLARLPIGRHELRLTVNNPDEDPAKSGSQRMFQSTGWQVCNQSCTPSYRSGDFVEARGWYTGHGYQNPRLTSPLSTVRSGGVIKVKLDKGSGGLTTRFTGIYIDPDMHGGNAGIVVRESTAAFSGSVTLPVLPSGPHRLVLLASDGKNAGVLLVPFVVP